MLLCSAGGNTIHATSTPPKPNQTLENIALESTRTIDIDEFVPKSSIDPRNLIRPYYLVPDGKVGHDALAVIEKRFAA